VKLPASLTTQYIATIAGGMAAMVALVSVMLALGYQSLPFPQPESLVEFWETAPSGSVLGISDPDIADLASAAAGAFSAVGGFAVDQTWFRDASGPIQVRYLMVRPGAFRALAAATVLGRGFNMDDTPAGGDQVAPAWISYAFWRSRYGSSPGIIGTEFTTAETATGAAAYRFRVAGVLPPHAAIPLASAPEADPAEFWTILPQLSNRQAAGEFGLGRLRPGVTPERAEASLAAAAERLGARFSFDRHKRVQVDGLQAIVQRPARRSMGILSLGAMLLFLVALVNVATLMVAEGMRRRREIATRVALGAGPIQLWIELATPRLALTFLAIAGGAALSLVVIRLLSQLLPAVGLGAALPTPPPLNLPVTIAFSVLVLASALVWTAALARAAASPSLARWLTADTGPGSTISRAGLRSGWRLPLLTAQAGAAVCLVGIAAAATQMYANQSAVYLGPAPDRTYLLEVAPANPGSLSPLQYNAFGRQVIDRLSALPNTAAVARTIFLPPLSYPAQFVKRGDPPGTDRTIAPPDAVSQAYFQTLGIPILYGRPFTRSDSTDNGGRVTILSRAAASANWSPPAQAVGAQIAFGKVFKEPYLVIGIAGDFGGFWSRHPSPMAYIPDFGPGGARNTIIWRARSGPPASLPAVQGALRSLAPPARLVRASTMEDRWQATLTRPRARMIGMLLLALAAFALSLQGIYAVIVAIGEARSHELGVRTALGAPRFRLLWAMVRDVAAAVGLGTALGIVGSWALQPVLRHWLSYPFFWSSGAVSLASLVFVFAAAVAALFPAWAASRANPADVLRQT
jgi:predicted permease